MKEFNRPVVRQLQANLQTELDAIGKKLGVGLTMSGCTFGLRSATFKIEATIPNHDGTIETKPEMDFKASAQFYGLKPTDLHKTFQEGGKTWKIVGLLPKNHTYPILVSNGNKDYKFPADRVRRAIGTSSVPSSRRTDQEIINDLQRVECNLSPESLTCDGEASQSYIKSRRAQLQRERESLIRELGREPTFEELWPTLAQYRTK